ncbi:MAG: M48 family metallopeptidase [Patescibacteria group bacterium]
MYNQITANKRKTVLLLGLFILVILGIGWVFETYYNTGYGTLGLAGIFSIVMALASYYAGDKVALATSGARRIQKEDNPYLFRIIENLAITAGLPLPKVHIITDPAPNAFACGRDPEHASIAVTTGLLDQMENEELEGVLSHELSHIKNYDIRVMTVVIICVGIITLLADLFLRGRFLGMGGDRRRENNNAAGIFLILGLVLIVLSPIFARLIQFAVSRKREFLADASGALLTRYPEGLARALEKIAAYERPLARANHATAHLYLSNPFGSDRKKRSGWTTWFSTHPPIDERIRLLRTMA